MLLPLLFSAVGCRCLTLSLSFDSLPDALCPTKNPELL
jgi:hypothetical protein